MSASKVWWPELSQLSLCSEFDKENSMEFLLISLPTYTLYYCGYALTFLWSSCYSSHVTHCDCDLWHDHLWPSVTPLWYCDKVTWYFPTLHLVVVSPIKWKEKKKEKNINNDLGIFLSYNNALESKMTQDRRLSLQPSKRLESHPLFREEPPK